MIGDIFAGAKECSNCAKDTPANHGGVAAHTGTAGIGLSRRTRPHMALFRSRTRASVVCSADRVRVALPGTVFCVPQLRVLLAISRCLVAVRSRCWPFWVCAVRLLRRRPADHGAKCLSVRLPTSGLAPVQA